MCINLVQIFQLLVYKLYGAHGVLSYCVQVFCLMDTS